MAIYFKRLQVGHPEPLSCPPDWEGCWKIYQILDDSSSRARADIGVLGQPDKANAQQTLVSLTNKAHTGQPLADLYDDKQCHEAHSFKLENGEEIKIFRIWGAGAIRVYFLYFPGKNIVILKIEPKRKDKLTSGEKEVLKNMAKEVLECIEKHGFIARIKPL